MSGTVQMPDVSSYPHAQPQNNNTSFDPFGVMEKMAQTQNLQNQNALFQQQFRARAAMGPIYQHSMTPDGDVDINKLLTGMAANPDTAFMAGDVINQALQRKLTQADILGKSLDNAQKQADHVAQVGAGLLGKAGIGSSISMDDYIPAVSNAVAMGYLTKDQGLTALSQAQSMNPQQLTQHVKQLVFANKTASETLEKVRGSIQMVDVGGRVQPTQVSPITGTATALPVGTAGGTAVQAPSAPQGGDPSVPAGAPAGGGGNNVGQVSGDNPLAKTPTPGEMNETVTTRSGSGAPVVMPKGAVQPMFTGSGTQIPGTGSQGSQIAPPPQAMEYLEGKGPAVEYEKDLNTRTGTAIQAMQNFNEFMDTLFDSDGKAKTYVGGHAEVYKRAAELAQGLGASQDTVDKIAGGNLAAAQKAVKLAITNTFTSLRQSLGGEGRLAVKEFEEQLNRGTPNIEMDPRALKSMVGYLNRMAATTMLEQQAWTAAKKHGVTTNWKDFVPTDFPAKWTEQMKKNNLLHMNDDRAKTLVDKFLAPGQ